jgi:hypothetical protein
MQGKGLFLIEAPGSRRPTGELGRGKPNSGIISWKEKPRS